MYLKKLMRPKIINKWIKTSVKRQVHGMILHVVIIFNLVNFIFLEPLFRVPDIESKYDTTNHHHSDAATLSCYVTFNGFNNIYKRLSSCLQPDLIATRDSVVTQLITKYFFSDQIFLLRVYQRTGLLCSGAPAAKIYIWHKLVAP